MKRYIYFIIALVFSMFLYSCNLEDDIDEMFVGKSWYMVGGKLNGTELNSEVKNFYQDGSLGYKLVFQSSTFVGELSKGITFSGYWNVNAKSRDISLVITTEPTEFNTFDHNVYTVLKGIKYYKGDSNYLEFFQDKDNYIRFNFER